MARSHTAYLNRSDVPVRADLQKAMDQFGFKVTLDHSYAPFKVSGYLPCILDGEDSGFNMRFCDVDSKLPSALASGIEGRDTAIGFSWAGDPREELAALTVCAALVGQFGAIVHGGDDDKLLSLEELLAKAKKARASL
ncbi:MAG: hypothetical protein J2P53_05475 [Bradyrhizobiaceae bacterium]|nr:hypothetical protein [Bradyrhizobiaceae bacterium]